MTTEPTPRDLALNGGAPVRSQPMPARGLITALERQAVLEVLDAAVDTGEVFGYNGPREKEYEQTFAASLDGGYADAVNSGTNALYVALGALQLPPFSEVIVPAITDPGGIMPVPLLACVPVVADVAPESFNTHAAAIADLITPRTRAVVVAHIGGEPVDMEPVVDLTRRHGLYLIEDCAQSHGAVYADTAVGTFGHIAAFSTMSGKHHCTGAQGGIVFTRDPELAGRARRFADRGKPFDLPGAAGNVRAGLNCNQNELAAAIGSVQLSRLPGILDRRRRVATTIRDALADAGPVCVGREPPSSVCSYWFLRMRFRAEAVRVSKAEYCRALAAEGIPVVPDYQAIPALFPWFRDRAVLGTAGFPWTCAEYTGSRTPVAHTDEACRSVARHFHLPIHEGYGDPEIEDILTAIRKLNHALGA